VTLYVAAPDVKLGFTFGPQLEFDRPTTKPPRPALRPSEPPI